MREEAIRAGLAALDFCGNVNEAIQQVAEDNETRFTAAEIASIKEEVYAHWNRSRRAAGVTLKKRASYTENLLFR